MPKKNLKNLKIKLCMQQLQYYVIKKIYKLTNNFILLCVIHLIYICVYKISMAILVELSNKKD